MAKAKAGPISADRLKSFIERVEKLKEEQKAIGGDIRDVFSEAKGVGYDVKTMRRIIQLRSMDAADRDEAEALLDTYAHALGMAVASHNFGVQPSDEEIDARAAKLLREVDRCMMVVVNGKPPTIAAIMGALDCSLGKASKIRGLCEQRIKDGISFSSSRGDEAKNENEIAVSSSRAAGGDEGLKQSGEGHAVTLCDPPSDKPEPNAGAAWGAEAPAPVTPDVIAESCGGGGTPIAKPVPPTGAAPGPFTTEEEKAARKVMGLDGVAVEVNAAPGSVLDRVGRLLEHVAPDRVQRNATVGPDDDLAIPAFLDRRRPKVSA